MWYDLTYACGHNGREQLVGPYKDREKRLEYLRTCMCPECAATARKERIDQQAKIDSSLGIPSLIGSDKQIAWAQELRKSFLQEWDKMHDCAEKNKVKYAESLSPEDTEKEYSRAVNLLALAKEQALSHTSACWWINNRFECLKQAIADAKKSLNACANDSTKVAVDAKAEATVIPQIKDKTIVPEIEVKEGEVIVRSAKDEDLRQIVRRLGFRFSAGFWRKKITIFTGSAEDRAAEVGNALLLAGFAVIIYDEGIRQKAIRADFEPECNQWVAIRIAGKYNGWLSILFPRGRQDLYDAARKITGSIWDSPNVVVPIQYHQQVEDFAEMLGFRLTPGAQESIAAYKSHRNDPAQVARPAKKQEDDKLTSILNTSTDILPGLRDDE